MNKKEIKKAIKAILNNPKGWEMKYDSSYYSECELEELSDENYEMNYLGSFMELDPCGKYHHFLSPNGIQKRCERFWNNLEEVCNELNCWTESGECDLCDVFLCRVKMN